VGVWFQHHVHSVVFSLGRACRKPWATLLTVMVMALALALPLGLSIALDNLKQFAGSVQQSRDINVFLKATSMHRRAAPGRPAARPRRRGRSERAHARAGPAGTARCRPG
jgi:cell division protein FtsX